MQILNVIQPEATKLVWVIYQLVKVTSSVALGVILFTLILKAITLPFDFISRFSMRKNSLKMEEMRPELERLQRQYADNKDLYNQKMMALYKKNGYSAFGACLPSIITIVIFIVAINGFTSYSRFQNVDYYYQMSVAYNNVVYAGLEADGEYIKFEDGVLTVDDDAVYSLSTGTHDIEGKDFDLVVTAISMGEEKSISVCTTNGYSKYSRATVGGVWGTVSFSVVDGALTKENVIKNELNNYLKNSDGDTFENAKTKNESLTESDFIENVREYMSAKKFRSIDSSFLWVKNIWVQDKATSHPVQDYKTFEAYGKTSCESCNGCSGCTQAYEVPDETGYDKLTALLSEEKEQANGYYILVVLTAGISLLTQLVMSKSQKAQMELQTVDGQGAQQQKMMMWMMPIMMAIFSFSYTAAFSIYIILSSLISMLSTLGINALVDKKDKKQRSQREKQVVHGKVYVKKQEPKKAEPKKAQAETRDFLSGVADKKKKHK